MTRLSAVALGASLLVARTARAQPETGLLEPRPSGLEAGAFATPQHFALELKFGPYLPEVDSEFASGTHPYESTFGTDDLLLSLLEFDWEYLRVPGGTLSVGVTTGFMQAVGKAKTPDGRTSGEDTVLNVIPVYYSVGFRLDLFATEWNIPLVPYVKGGFTTYYWWILNGAGTAAWSWTPGWHFTPGILLQLDWFDPSTARNFDTSVGVNHTYLMFEMLWAGVDGFDNGTSMILSDLTWTAGLAFEF
jgi:hypothetical protein